MAMISALSSSNPVDMKVAKFKMMYERIYAYLVNSSGVRPTIYIFPIDHYSNDYFCNLEKYLLKNLSLHFRELRWENDGNDSLDDLVHTLQNYTKPINAWQILFWHLMLLAVDDEAYNNELGNVIDLAYNLHFTEPMIRDWCRAVEYVLDGNELKEDCDLQCETEEGKKFFLHQE